MIDHQHLRLYIQREAVHDTETFIEWLTLFINEQLTYSDGLAMRIVYNALIRNDKDKILDINQKLFVQNLPKETRIGAKQMGTRMVKLALDLYESEWIQWYYDQMKSHKIQLHPAVCFTMLGHDLCVNVESIIDYYLYQNISSLTQNAVRAIPLGQTAGQQVVTEMISHIEKVRNHILELAESDFGMTAPGLELNQMEHENVHVRIFIS